MKSTEKMKKTIAVGIASEGYPGGSLGNARLLFIGEHCCTRLRYPETRQLSPKDPQGSQGKERVWSLIGSTKIATASFQQEFHHDSPLPTKIFSILFLFSGDRYPSSHVFIHPPKISYPSQNEKKRKDSPSPLLSHPPLTSLMQIPHQPLLLYFQPTDLFFRHILQLLVPSSRNRKVSFGRNDVEVVEWFGLNEVVVGCVVVVAFCDAEVM